jgi:hypothetical protein
MHNTESTDAFKTSICRGSTPNTLQFLVAHRTMPGGGSTNAGGVGARSDRRVGPERARSVGAGLAGLTCCDATLDRGRKGARAVKIVALSGTRLMAAAAAEVVFNGAAAAAEADDDSSCGRKASASQPGA